MISVTLPWPDKDLFPNRKAHWAVLHNLRLAAHQTAYLATIAAMHGKPVPFGDDDIMIEYVFRYPTNSKRDRDNLLAACKAYQDGIAEALGVDDSVFEPVVLRRGDNMPGGAVIVTIGHSFVTFGDGKGAK